MQQKLEELNHINELISEDVAKGAAALQLFRKENHPIRQKLIAAKVDLLQLVIGSVLTNYAEQKIDDEKLLAYFESEKRIEEAAQLLLAKTRHFFIHGRAADGEKLLHYFKENYLGKVSVRSEIVYLTRMCFLHGTKYEFEEKVNLSLRALEKLKAMDSPGIWNYNMQTIFSTNVADAYGANEDHEKAWPYLAEAIEIAEKQSISIYNKINVYNLVAMYYIHRQERGQAMLWHNKIVSMLKNNSDYKHSLFQAHLNAANEYANLFRETSLEQIKLRENFMVKQAEHIDAVRNLLPDGEHSNNLHLIYCTATLEWEKKNFSKALAHLNKCLLAYQERKHYRAITDCYHLLHEIYHDWGEQTKDVTKLKKACEYLKTYREMVGASAKQTDQQKLENFKTKQELLQKQMNQKIMQQQMESINKELRLTALNLHEKIVLLDELKVYIHSLKKKEFEVRSFIDIISRKIGSIKITEQDKALLQEKIDAGNIIFFKALSELHPALSTHEVRICGLLKSGMTDKELAKIYGLGERGYAQLRYRIKKKMKLKRADNLIQYLNKLSISN